MIKRKRASWSSGLSSLWDNDTDFHQQEKKENNSLTCVLSISPKRLRFKRHILTLWNSRLGSCVKFSRFWTLFVGSKKSEYFMPQYDPWKLTIHSRLRECHSSSAFDLGQYTIIRLYHPYCSCSSTTLPIYYQNSSTPYTVGHMPPVYTPLTLGPIGALRVLAHPLENSAYILQPWPHAFCRQIT